jgi:hypothetical protein
MLQKLGIFEIDADITQYSKGQLLIPLEDNQSLEFLASMGIKKMFKGERFYQIGKGMNSFLLRTADFHLVGTIDNRIYKIYFKFLDETHSAAMDFRGKIRTFLSENMPPQQLRNPQVTTSHEAQLSTWPLQWGNILLEEFSVRTPTGNLWNTAIAGTSNIVKSAKRIGLFDRLFGNP